MIEPTLVQLRIVAALLFLTTTLAVGVYLVRRKRVARLLGDAVVIRQLLGADLAAIPWPRVAPVLIAAAGLAIALLDPALAATRTSPAGPVVLLLDASGSMLVDDLGRSRLEVQREFARALVAELPDIPIGLVAFSGRAFSLTPPTLDRGAVEMYLSALDPTIVTQSGSGFGAAIRQGVGLLGAGGEGGGVLVLLGDGDETENPEASLEAAALAARQGTRIHSVGVGTNAGGPVPALDLTTGAREGHLLAPGGDPLVSRLDEGFLTAIANRTGGTFSRAEEPGSVAAVRGAILSAAGPNLPVRGIPRYGWLAGAALLLLLVEPIAARREIDR
jgi:Ca-activated chloride channel homolog